LIEKLKGHLRITERPLTEVFQQFEPNADGFIHQTEFRQAIRRLNLGLSAREIDQLMQRIDEDRDGRISFNEFAAKFAMGNCEFEMRIRTKDKLAQLKELLMTHMTSTADAFRFVSAPPSYLSCLV
jgi:Ca2+-binding EF-hand superfamily protein